MPSFNRKNRKPAAMTHSLVRSTDADGNRKDLGSASVDPHSNCPLTASSVARQWIRRTGYGIVNLWLIFHLIGVFLPAFSIPPSPEIVRNLYWSLRFYPQAIYMDHGYHFFGPDPGDSTLLRFVASKEDGTTQRGTFPDKNIFPRLRYHRHFMLTEAIPRVGNFDDDLGDLLARTYAERILKATGTKEVRLYRVTHQIPSADRFLAGVRLDDPETYMDESIGRFAIKRAVSVEQK